MKLKDGQVEFIEKDLIKRGITSDPLHEDLLDHICCEVEITMKNGATFMDAYQRAISVYEKRDLRVLNSEYASILTNFSMVKNFFVTSSRFFMKNLGYSLIRVLGLALGLGVFILSFLYMQYESSYDAFHKSAESTYRIGRNVERGQVTTTTFPLVPALRNDFPQYTFSRYFKNRSNTLFRISDKSYYEERMIFGDNDFLKIFDFDGFLGNKESALKNPFSVVITQEIARKYFGDKQALGELIEFDWNGASYPLKVTGIIPKWPKNMHIDFNIIVSFQTGESVFPSGISTSWDMNYCYSYVKLPSEATSSSFESNFEDFVEQHVGNIDKDYRAYLGFLQPLTKIHLQPNVLSTFTKTLDPKYPKIAISIGFLVLLITSINFITLTLAQFQDRAKEVGIRKAIGANRQQVILQLVLETLILVSISFLISVGLVYLLLDWVNQYLVTDISLSMLRSQKLIYSIPIAIITITLITGLYPAIFFSAQNIMGTIQFNKKSWKKSIQHTLLTTQFVIAAVLIVLSIVIYKQIEFVKNKELGYAKDQMIYIPHGRQIRYDSNPFKTQAKAHPAIEEVSLSFYKPTDDIGNYIDYTLDGKEAVSIGTTSVDEDFFQTFGLGLVTGATFPKEGADLTKMIVINESAAELLGLKNPVGSILKSEFSTGSPSQPIEKRESQIIGVIKDVHFESLHNPIKPLVFIVKPYWYFYINVRINGQNMAAGLDHLDDTWRSMFNNEPFEYIFLDQEFEQLYKTEDRASKGLIAMSILAIITACLGLFGYVRYLLQQKIKEVSVRKVLGAGTMNIANLLSKDFLIIVLISNVISWPIAYYICSDWLSNFSYHVGLSIIPFVITFFLLITLAFLTIIKELFSVLSIEPAEALRYD